MINMHYDEKFTINRSTFHLEEHELECNSCWARWQFLKKEEIFKFNDL